MDGNDGVSNEEPVGEPASLSERIDTLILAAEQLIDGKPYDELDRKLMMSMSKSIVKMIGTEQQLSKDELALLTDVWGRLRTASKQINEIDRMKENKKMN